LNDRTPVMLAHRAEHGFHATPNHIIVSHSLRRFFSNQ